jgi:hypothetical protein
MSTCASIDPLGIALNGRSAMAAFSKSLTDGQIAAVVDFAHSSCDNPCAGGAESGDGREPWQQPRATEKAWG